MLIFYYFFFPFFVFFMDLFSHCIHILYFLCCFYLLLFISFLILYLFYAYSIHFLCSSILVFVLLLICFSWNSIFFQKLTFQMSYDRFELFFCVKSSFEHGHGLPRSLSLLLLRFFPFFDFYFRITLSIYVLYKKQFLVVAINCLFFTTFSFRSLFSLWIYFHIVFTFCTSYAASICFYSFLSLFFTCSMPILFTFYALLSLSLYYSLFAFLEIQYFFKNSLSRWATTVLSCFFASNPVSNMVMASPDRYLFSFFDFFLFSIFISGSH